MLFDSHAHVNDGRFDDDREAVWERAAAAGVTGIINIGADMESSAASVQLARERAEVYAAVGIHPHDAAKAREEDYVQLETWLQEEAKVIAVGEIGLDYYYNLSPREVQKKVFIRQLELARKIDKPFIIHDRDAHGDCMDILGQYAAGLRGVFHCYSGSLEMAKEILRHGWYISFAGPLTFEKSVNLKAIAEVLPLDRILVETDSPYLTPHPFRGRRNEPARVRLVAEELARLRKISYEEVAQATSANVKQLFQI